MREYLASILSKNKQTLTLSAQHGLICVKVNIKDAVIYINYIIWGCVLALYLDSTDFRCNLNYKYGAVGFCYVISSTVMDEYM